MPIIPETVLDLLEKPIISSLTTIAPDGIPENTAVWAYWDGEHVLISTTDGRRKPKNIRNNPNVALFILDPTNGQRWLDIRGVVADMPVDEGYETINLLSKFYTGADEFYGGVVPIEQKGTEDRLVIKIKPLRIASRG